MLKLPGKLGLLFAVVGAALHLQTVAAETASWQELQKDSSGPLTTFQQAQVEEIKVFRAEIATALQTCDREKLLDMYAADYMVTEGSGWVLDREGAVNACGNTSWTSGVEDTSPLTMTIRSLGDDAAVATGTSRLERGGATPTVRWMTVYGKNSDGNWQQAYAQVHRVPPEPPGPPLSMGRLAGAPGTPPIPMPALTPEWLAQLAKDQPLDSAQNDQLEEELANWVAEFAAAAATRDLDNIDNFYAENFAMTHGSGYVESRESRMGGAAQRGRVAELMQPIVSTVRSVGEDGAVLATIVPFAFDSGWDGFLRTSMALRRSPDSDSAGWQVATLLVNSFWVPVINVRIPSGCERAPEGNPPLEGPEPHC